MRNEVKNDQLNFSIAVKNNISRAMVADMRRFQGGCRVNRLSMPLFSRPAALDPGSTQEKQLSLQVLGRVTPLGKAESFSLGTIKILSYSRVAWNG